MGIEDQPREHCLQDIAWISEARALPALPGAYALWITLSSPTPLPRRFGETLIPPGGYLYLGSAYGPGGLRARCGRHLSRTKSRRWHVDWLTTQASDVRAAVFVNGCECTLTSALLAAGASVPLPGFGSSDCQNCPSHLLQLPTRPPAWPFAELGDKPSCQDPKGPL